MIKSDDESLIMSFDNFELLLGMVIWYEIMFAINSILSTMPIDEVLRLFGE